jgi:NACalpha-BTF3-like transcription factor
MGINFSDLAAICESFTGEMTGGMSFGQTGIIFEMIGVLKDPNKAADFLEAVYLPWLMKYSQNITNMMEKQLGMKMEQIYIRTSGSTVDGHKVIGVKTQFPLFPPSMKTPETKKMSSLMKFESRMTTVGNLFLIAPNDKRMGELIKISKKLEERPAKGPLMSMDVDMAKYFNAIAEMMPELSAGREPLPKMGKINILIDINNGQIIETASIMMDDIRTLISHFKKITTSGKAAMEKKAPEEMQKAEKKYVPEEDAAFWLDKGALCATYGNDKLAIKYFKKAIELDPQKSEAYFQIGISYGETGEYQEAISSINKALKLGPNKGLYYYGRGRIYLLSGDKEKAIEDFKHAATIGNKDAQNYLQNVAHIPWE